MNGVMAGAHRSLNVLRYQHRKMCIGNLNYKFSRISSVLPRHPNQTAQTCCGDRGVFDICFVVCAGKSTLYAKRCRGRAVC